MRFWRVRERSVRGVKRVGRGFDEASGDGWEECEGSTAVPDGMAWRGV